jgi:hypothetical protein
VVHVPFEKVFTIDGQNTVKPQYFTILCSLQFVVVY